MHRSLIGQDAPLGAPAKHKKSMRKISILLVNVVAQMRKTFDPTEMQELSGSIEEKGVLNAPIVALFGREELEQYLQLINRLWGTRYQVEELKSCRIDGQVRWYVLLAGERRYRSYIPLVKAGKCSRFLQMTAHEHLDYFDAVDIQFSENSHCRPPPHEEAQAYAQYYALQDALGQLGSLAGFARRVGRSASAIKAALRFVSLPEVIRHAVAGNWNASVPEAELFAKRRLKLPYGIAVELARLAEVGIPEHELVNRMVGAVISGTKVEQFREQVTKQIEDLGQDMFDLLSAAAEEASRLKFRRRTVEARISRILAAEEQWLARVLVLFAAGHIGKEDSPYARGSVRDRMIRIGDLYAAVYELFYQQPPASARERLAAVRRLSGVLQQEAQLLPFERPEARLAQL